MVAMICHTEPASKTPNRMAIPEAHNIGPPTSPSMARRRGTKPDRYIS
jgi:hypothetical protein